MEIQNCLNSKARHVICEL